MQKRFIALAVAALASTSAFAQSNVTIYGSVDAGYAYRWDPERNATGQHSRSSIDSGNALSNRLGFKGSEDVGNGLKAIFVLEQGFNFDIGAMGQGGKMFGRQAYVGLSGNFGTVMAGRIYTPYFALVAGLDPFSAGTVGQYRNVWGNTGPTNITASNPSPINNLLDLTRIDNAVSYISPKFGGVDVTIAYSNAASPDDVAAGNENSGNNARNNTLYAALARYAAGPVNVGFSVHRIAAGSAMSNATLKTLDNYTLGGTFDASVIKIAAAASYSVWDTSLSQGDASMSNYLLGATVPIGKFALKASVNYSDFNGGSHAAAWQHGTATQYALGADYNLSKRTSLYTAYSLIDAQHARRFTATMSDAGPNNGNAAANNPFQQGFQLGVRHQF